MIITRTSQLSGIERSMDLPITEEQLAAWKAGTLIQRAMPNLSDDEREFVMTGITAEEWDSAFGPEPDCDDSDDGQALASAGWGTDEDY